MKTAPSSETSVYWDHIARSWESRVPQRLWRKYSDTVCQSLLDRHLLPGQQRRALKTDVFDEAVACGILSFLASRCNEVIGCDISSQVIRMAKQRNSGALFVAADVRGFPFIGESFDLVVSLSTLDHLDSVSAILQALHEIFRILKPGGKLILTLDNLANPIVALRNLLPFQMLHRIGIVPYSVGATCGPRRLKSLMIRSGFKVEEMRSGFHSPRVLAIPIVEWIDKHFGAATKQKALSTLMRFEGLENWPTRYLTGHLIIAIAKKPLHVEC
jgi:SAM-dependent methyltransferase